MSSIPNAEGEKILIVDDDARLRRLLERFFEEQGYRVHLGTFCPSELTPRNILLLAERSRSAQNVKRPE